MNHDNLAEWSKALDLGSSPQGREFKSHSCHCTFIAHVTFNLLPLRLGLLRGTRPQLVLPSSVLLCTALTLHWCMLQDDIMYTNLTVEENLLFSAQYRLPVHYTHAQHVYYVERAIQVCECIWP